jgi:NAD(P)-binding Rossmann-like domain
MAPSVAGLTGGHGTLPVDSHPRTNGSHTTNGHSAGDVTIREENYGTKKKKRIAMLGAGISGINFFKFAEQKLENVEIVCYEKNHDVGGTWLENRYPGCACDIPSVVYQFPWRPVCAFVTVCWDWDRSADTRLGTLVEILYVVSIVMI